MTDSDSSFNYYYFYKRKTLLDIPYSLPNQNCTEFTPDLHQKNAILVLNKVLFLCFGTKFVQNSNIIRCSAGSNFFNENLH